MFHMPLLFVARKKSGFAENTLNGLMFRRWL
jgi:hypothetical protein